MRIRKKIARDVNKERVNFCNPSPLNQLQREFSRRARANFFRGISAYTMCLHNLIALVWRILVPVVWCASLARNHWSSPTVPTWRESKQVLLCSRKFSSSAITTRSCFQTSIPFCSHLLCVLWVTHDFPDLVVVRKTLWMCVRIYAQWLMNRWCSNAAINFGHMSAPCGPVPVQANCGITAASYKSLGGRDRSARCRSWRYCKSSTGTSILLLDVRKLYL